jgi:hypothetical protein
MKKQQMKKLALAKETLRGLTPRDFRDVAGASDYTPGCNSWEWMRRLTSAYCTDYAC